MRTLFKAFVAMSMLFLLSMSVQVKANEDPVALLDRTTVKMLSALDQNQSAIKANVTRLYQLIDEILAPHMNFTEMAHWVAGRQPWDKATDAEKREFTNALRVLLIRTYANSLSNLKGVVVTYSPIRSDITGKSRIQVTSKVKVPGKETIEVSYRLMSAGGSWQVYDILVEGVSLLKGFKSQYADDMTKKGIIDVTTRIQALNQKGNNK